MAISFTHGCCKEWRSFANYGVDILVKRRSNEPLARLNSDQQSGSERERERERVRERERERERGALPLRGRDQPGQFVTGDK